MDYLQLIELEADVYIFPDEHAANHMVANMARQMIGKMLSETPYNHDISDAPKIHGHTLHSRMAQTYCYYPDTKESS